MDGKHVVEGGGPIPLSRVISELVVRRGWNQQQGDQVLIDAWKQITEHRVSSHTRVGSLRNGVLTIHVSNSPLLGELVSFHKISLLLALKQKLPSTRLKELKFKLDSSIHSKT